MTYALSVRMPRQLNLTFTIHLHPSEYSLINEMIFPAVAVYEVLESKQPFEVVDQIFGYPRLKY